MFSNEQKIFKQKAFKLKPTLCSSFQKIPSLENIQIRNITVVFLIPQRMSLSRLKVFQLPLLDQFKLLTHLMLYKSNQFNLLNQLKEICPQLDFQQDGVKIRDLTMYYILSQGKSYYVFQEKLTLMVVKPKLTYNCYIECSHKLRCPLR